MPVSPILIHLEGYNFLPYQTNVTEKAQRQVFYYLNDEGMPVGVWACGSVDKLTERFLQQGEEGRYRKNRYLHL